MIIKKVQQRLGYETKYQFGIPSHPKTSAKVTAQSRAPASARCLTGVKPEDYVKI